MHEFIMEVRMQRWAAKEATVMLSEPGDVRLGTHAYHHCDTKALHSDGDQVSLG